MVTVRQRSGHEQVLARHIHRPALAEIAQRRLQNIETFVEGKNAFDLFVAENERNGWRDYDFNGLSRVKVKTAAPNGKKAIAVSAVGKP